MNSDTIADGEALPGGVDRLGYNPPLPSPDELTHFARAISMFGNGRRLAMAAGLPQPTVNHMSKGARAIYAEAAVAIERATGGLVGRHQLRPDLWPAPCERPDDEDCLVDRVSLAGPDLMALQETRFRAYQDAFHRNAGDPNLQHAAALVRAYNDFADAMGLDRI